MSAPSARPNIVFITSHDLGRHLGCYGVETVHSERLDALAGDGVRFARSFCSAPQCSPSRASMFTGRWPHSNGVLGLTHGDFGWDLYDDEQHLAAILADAGWTTAYAGHVHETRRPECFGLQQRVATPGGRAPAVAEGVAQFIREQQGRSEPFYLQVGFIEPHRLQPDFGAAPDTSRGVTVPPYLVDDLPSREEFAYFQGAIRMLDEAVGRIVDALAETGQLDDTLLVFVADHGIPFPRAKCAVYDAGLEVATILSWPNGDLPRGEVVEPMISNVDLLPSILELVALPVPEQVQGRSFAPLLLGGPYEARRDICGEMTYHDYCDPRRCLRTETHKVIANFTSAPDFMDPSQSWRRGTITKVPDNPPYAYHPPVELYDLVADPLEQVNLATAADHAELCRELLDRLYEWMVATDDPLLDGIPTSPLHRRALAALAGDDEP